MKKALLLILALLIALIPCTYAETIDPSATGTWYLQELIVPEDIAEAFAVPAHLTKPGAEVAVIISSSGDLLLQWTDNMGYNGDYSAVYDWIPELALEYGAINDTKFGDSVGKIQDGRLYLDFADMTLICGREKPYFDFATCDDDTYCEMLSGIDIWYSFTWDLFIPEEDSDEPAEESIDLLPPAFDASEVIGTWYMQEALIDGMPVDLEYIDYRIFINEDGTAIHRLNDMEQNAVWMISGNQILFTFPDDDSLFESHTLQEDGTLLCKTDEENYNLFSREDREVSALPQAISAESLEPFQGMWQLDTVLLNGTIPQSTEIIGATSTLTVSDSSISIVVNASEDSDFYNDAVCGKVFSGTLQLTDGALSGNITDGKNTYPVTLGLCEDGTVRCLGEWVNECFYYDTALSFVPATDDPAFCGRWYLHSYSNSDGGNTEYASVDYCIGILDLNEDGTFALNLSGNMPTDAYEAIAGENTGVWILSGSEVLLQRTHGADQSFVFNPAAGTLLPKPYVAKGLMQFTREAPATLTEDNLLGKWMVYSHIAPKGSDTGMSIEFKKDGECLFIIEYKGATDVRVGSWKFISDTYVDATLPDGQTLHLKAESNSEMIGVNGTSCSMVKAD